MNDFITSAYWQRGCNDSALLLQHYRYREVPLCFCCICAGEGENRGRAAAYLADQLFTWFRGLSIKRLAKDPESRLPGLEGRLKEVIERAEKELETQGLLRSEERLDFAGILCVGEYFLLFREGRCQVCLLNRCFDRGHFRRIAENPVTEGDILLYQGILQREIGLLLATESFCAKLDDWEIKECLHVETVGSESQAQRHLLELGYHAEELGGRHMGAVLLLT